MEGLPWWSSGLSIRIDAGLKQDLETHYCDKYTRSDSRYRRNPIKSQYLIQK